MATLEFGLDTFLPVTVDQAGLPISGDQVIRNAVEEAVLAEAVGIDSFNIGEHYRTEFMDSAGHVVLAAIASRTERIRLGTSVTVLSTQDPVRLYTDFATLLRRDDLDALGRDRVDRHSRCAETTVQKDLGERAAERVTHDDRR